MSHFCHWLNFNWGEARLAKPMLQLWKTKRFLQIFREVSGVFQQNFNGSKNSAVLDRGPKASRPRTWGFKAKDLKVCPRGQGRPRGLQLWVILYDPRTVSANKNSAMGVMLSNISRAPVGCQERLMKSLGKQVSASLQVSSLDTFCWDGQPRTHMHTTRRVARIWKRGVGLFWKSEKSANDLDPNFHCSWISFTRFVRKLRENFSESSEIQTFFPPKIRWSPKKRSSPKLGLIFRPNPEIQTFEGGLFSYWGGYFQFFTKNWPQKHQKRAILHTSQANGGARAPPAPPPGYATAYDMIGRIIAVQCVCLFNHKWFYSHNLFTICLHCINAVVALRVIRVICGFQVSLLSRVTPNSLASKESSSFEPFIDKEPKSGFCLWVSRQFRFSCC